MISGFFDPGSPNWPVPQVGVMVLLPGTTSTWNQVFFLLDTGATRTCLHPADATGRLALSAALLAQPHYWPRQQVNLGVGGTALYYRVNARYGFHHDDGHWQELHGEIDIAQPTPNNQSFPSVLGWDGLQHFRVTADWRQRQLSLE